MQCDRCETEMGSRKASAEHPYMYRLSETPVRLVGIRVFQCQTCAGESPIIPNMSGLHRAIAGILARKEARLTGSEVRFLRKQIGFSARRFAVLIGVGASHISRVENGQKRHLGTAADKLARLVNVMANEDEAANEVILRLADSLLSKKRAMPWAFRLAGNQWTTQRRRAA